MEPFPSIKIGGWSCGFIYLVCKLNWKKEEKKEDINNEHEEASKTYLKLS